MRLLIRFVLWSITHTIYKLNIVGRENVPEHGPALLVSNHVTYVDGFLIGSCVKPLVRFIVWKPLFRVVVVNWALRMIKAIPAGEGGPRETTETIRRARKALMAGHIVCIFPEGFITRTGNLLPFKRGMEKIVGGLDAPIIPVRLDGLWGSIFSFERGRFFWKWPRRVPYPVTISFGVPMAASSTAQQVRETIQRLAGQAAALVDCQGPATITMRDTDSLARRFGETDT